MKYDKQLKTKEWARKRKKIMTRDGFICTACNSKKDLCVHHTIYIKGRFAWEYKDSLLITLCHKCHHEYHSHHEVEVVKDTFKDKPKTNKNIRKKGSLRNISKEDRKKRELENYIKRQKKEGIFKQGDEELMKRYAKHGK